MTRKKLEQIKRQMEWARRRSNSHGDLAGIAQSLGRKRAKGSQVRGKEPAYLSTEFPNLRPLTIPYHSGRDIVKGTAASILNQLEEDVLLFEQRLDVEEKKQKGSNGNGYNNGGDNEKDR